MTTNTTTFEGLSTNITMNNTANATSASPLDMDKSRQLLYILTTVFFSLIIALGLAGNSLVLATLTLWQEMRTPCNLLIANICAADLGVCLLAAPLRIIEIYRGWLFGSVLCYILTPIQDVLVCVSVVTHTTIALERHRAIVSPFKPKMMLSKVKVAIPIIWFACYVTGGVPMVVFLKHVQRPSGWKLCYPVFSEIDYRIAYEMYLVIVFITAPLLIQCVTYLNIIRVLGSKDEIQARYDSFNVNPSQRRTFRSRVRQKKRLIRMLIVLMVIFQMCYLPRGVIMLIREFSPETKTLSYFWYIDLVTMAMYYLKHVLNPVILWAMSNDFRSGCLSIMRNSGRETHLTASRNFTQSRKLQRSSNPS